MNPIRRGQLEHNISSVTVVFLDTNETKILVTKPNSVCHFFEPFQVENDTIKLRLDWSDLDEMERPTLDADFFDSKTGKKRSLKGKRRNAHHTAPINSEGRIYEWEFKNFTRPFIVKVCWIASLIEKFTATDIVTAEVIRAGKRLLN